MPNSRRTWRRGVAVLAALLAAGLLSALTGASPAGAHAVLRSSAPAANAVLEQAPGEVVLRLSEAPLAVGSVVEVTSESGAVVSTGKARVVGDEVRQPITATQAGRYRVDWRVTSSDGHPISDSFTFRVTTSAATSRAAPVAPPTTPTVPAPSATARSATAGGHHGSDVHAGNEFAFTHVAGTVVILLLGAFGCAISLRRSTASSSVGARSHG